MEIDFNVTRSTGKLKSAFVVAISISLPRNSLFCFYEICNFKYETRFKLLPAVRRFDHRSFVVVLRETVTALKDGVLLGISVSILSHVHFPIRHMATDKNHMPVYSHEHRADRYKT